MAGRAPASEQKFGWAGEYTVVTAEQVGVESLGNLAVLGRVYPQNSQLSYPDEHLLPVTSVAVPLGVVGSELSHRVGERLPVSWLGIRAKLAAFAIPQALACVSSIEELMAVMTDPTKLTKAGYRASRRSVAGVVAAYLRQGRGGQTDYDRARLRTTVKYVLPDTHDTIAFAKYIAQMVAGAETETQPAYTRLTRKGNRPVAHMELSHIGATVRSVRSGRERRRDVAPVNIPLSEIALPHGTVLAAFRAAMPLGGYADADLQAFINRHTIPLTIHGGDTLNHLTELVQGAEPYPNLEHATVAATVREFLRLPPDRQFAARTQHGHQNNAYRTGNVRMYITFSVPPETYRTIARALGVKYKKPVKA